MRTIKFRGKRLDTGDWVYGDLTTRFLSPRFSGDTCIFDGSWHCIDTATIGQYTGLKDRNGVEIYEGDILESPNEARFEVESEPGRFLGIRTSIKQKIRPAPKWMRSLYCTEKWATVIGNIHDNPELLKGGEV